MSWMQTESLIQKLKLEFNNRISRNRNYSMRAFARDVRIPQSTLSKLFSYKTRPSIEAITRICAILEVENSEPFISEALQSKVRKSSSRAQPARKDKVEITLRVSEFSLLFEQLGAFLRENSEKNLKKQNSQCQDLMTVAIKLVELKKEAAQDPAILTCIDRKK